MKKIGMSFGFTSVQNGVRNVNTEPQVVAVSTSGSFRLTPAVSKVLGIGHGDYAMFLNNISAIDNAIVDKAPELVNAVAEAGLEWNSAEANAFIHTNCDQWLVAKGIQEYDNHGVAKTCSERLSAKQRKALVSQNFEKMLEEVSNSDNEELKDAISREGITKDEQIELLMPFIVPSETYKFRGSRCANPACLTGAGVSVNFTDSNVWQTLKSDLGEDADKINRVFSVDLDDIMTVNVDNGYELVPVKAVVLGEYKDEQPARISSND